MGSSLCQTLGGDRTAKTAISSSEFCILPVRRANPGPSDNACLLLPSASPREPNCRIKASSITWTGVISSRSTRDSGTSSA